MENTKEARVLVGKRLRHPSDNRLVEIVDCDIESNWWNWRTVKGDGSLEDKVESGYGW